MAHSRTVRLSAASHDEALKILCEGNSARGREVTVRSDFAPDPDKFVFRISETGDNRLSGYSTTEKGVMITVDLNNDMITVKPA